MIKRDYYPIILLKSCNKDTKRYADTTTQVYLKEIRKLYLRFLNFLKDISKMPFQKICIDVDQ